MFDFERAEPATLPPSYQGCAVYLVRMGGEALGYVWRNSVGRWHGDIRLDDGFRPLVTATDQEGAARSLAMIRIARHRAMGPLMQARDS